MSKQRKGRSLQDQSMRGKARALLEKARAEDPHGRLPSARMCAAKWGGSEATFRRAREELERDLGPSATRPNGKWMQLVEKIKEDLATGKLRPGDHLDSGIQAASKWAASHPTLRKALRQLVKDGILVETPRGAEVPRPCLTPGTRILLVQHCDQDGLMVGEAERSARFRRELELYAHKAGTSLDVWGYAGGERFFRDGRPIANPRAKAVAYHGAVLSFWSMEECDKLLDAFRKSPNPVSVWDERPNGGDFEKSPLLRYFTCSYSADAGAAMVRHLADKGHRHVAYVSPLHGSVWSRARLHGVRAAAAARGAMVTECVFSEAVSHRAFDLSARRPDQFLRSRALREHLGSEISRSVDDLRERVAILLRLRVMRDLLSPLFAQALESGASVWICANDDVAALAWSWLSQLGVGIPTKVGLVGFDDTASAQTSGLTSFHFNEGDVAAAAMRHVLSPKRLRSVEMAGRQTTIPGFVVSRASVANVAKARRES